MDDEDLYYLIEQAAEAATGRYDTDISEYVIALEDEWITDVDALRKLDPSALDELLPRLLSQELQRLVHQKDRRYRPANRNSRWRHASRHSPPKKDVMMRSRGNPGNKSEEQADPPGVTPIFDEEFSSDDSASSKEEVQCGAAIISDQLISGHIASRKQNPKQSPRPGVPSGMKVKNRHTKGRKKKNERQSVFKILDLFDHMCSNGFKADEEPFDLLLTEQKEEEGIDDDELQEMSKSNPYMADATDRANHLIADASRKSNIIANARKRFSTREALEDAIHELETLLEKEEEEAAVAAVQNNKKSKSVLDVEAQDCTSPTEDKLRELYPLRLILPTVADLTAMLEIVQEHRQNAMRDLNIEQANYIHREIDELQHQIEQEERYLLYKKLGSVACVACDEKFTPPSCAAKEKHCETCRKVFGSVVVKNDDVEGRKEQRSIVKRVLLNVLSGRVIPEE